MTPKDVDMWTVFVISPDSEVKLLCECALPFRVATPAADEDVVQAVARTRPGVVLAEVVTPTDWQLIARLRTSPATRRVPVIVLTESRDVDRTFRRCAHQLGCSGFLAKSCDPDVLLKAVEDVLFAPEPLIRDADRPKR